MEPSFKYKIYTFQKEVESNIISICEFLNAIQLQKTVNYTRKYIGGLGVLVGTALDKQTHTVNVAFPSG